MRNHFQGIFLLGLLLAALWGMTRLASPTLSDAFGEDGAVMADSGDEDTIELTVEAETVDAELNTEELTRLQFELLLSGFLAEQSDIDGTMGSQTRAAIEAAAEKWGLTNPTDREVLLHGDELYEDNPFFAAP
jgi:hypothetical protein